MRPTTWRWSPGDDDLPAREALHERRAKYDSVRARQSARGGSDDDVQPGGGKRARPPARELDDTYVAAAAAAEGRKKARKEAYKMPDLAPPLPDEPADGARGINKVSERQDAWSPDVQGWRARVVGTAEVGLCCVHPY